MREPVAGMDVSIGEARKAIAGGDAVLVRTGLGVNFVVPARKRPFLMVGVDDAQPGGTPPLGDAS